MGGDGNVRPTLPMPQRALITGCSGFAGGFLAEHLLGCGDAVLGCSPDGRWEEGSPPELSDRVELLAWDLGRDERPPGEARRAIEAFRPTAVYHLAAISVPSQCGSDEPTPAAVAVNVTGTRRVMQLAAELPGRPRVLAVSSSKVYAPVRPEAPMIDEQAPLGPRGAYGKTKLAAEAEVHRAIEQSGVDAMIARSFQHTGPRQGPEMMLPHWCQQLVARDSGPIEVYTRDAMIDLSDVRDVVRAYRLLVERGEPGGVYNVGSGVSRRSGDVLAMLQELAGSDRPVVQLYPGEKHDPIADVARLAERTGWRATIPLEATVADTLAWWRERAI